MAYAFLKSTELTFDGIFGWAKRLVTDLNRNAALTTSGSSYTGITTPEAHGAVGDGVTNDKAALLEAISTGLIVLGDVNKTYAVSGELNISFLSPVRMHYVNIKQTTPVSDTKTILAQGNDKIEMVNVSVDKGNLPTAGSQANSTGIWIDGCPDLTLVNAEVFGKGAGTGIKLNNCSGVVERPHVHDLLYGTTANAKPSNDVIDGLWMLGCTGLKVISPRIHRLRTQWTGQLTPAPCFTRGITFAGGRDIDIVSADIELVDQGIDITGDENPGDITILGGSARECRLFGIKLANSPKRVRVYGFRCYKIGLAAFEVSPSNSAIGETNSTFDNIFDGCIADWTGYNKDAYGVLSGQSCAFKCESTSTYPTWPRATVFKDCRVIGRGVTQNGFVDQSTEYTVGSFKIIGNVGPYRNRLEGRCVAEGCTVAAVDGFLTGVSQLQAVGGGSGQSVATGVATLMLFNQASDEVTGFGDGLKLLTSSSGPVGTTTQPAVRYASRYQVTVQVEFSVGSFGTGSGDRTVEIGFNNMFNSRHRTIVPAANTNASFVPITAERELVAGDTISVRVTHDQGEYLDCTCTMLVTDLCANQGVETWVAM